MKKAVFLDRDGVINRAMIRDGKPYPPASLAEMELLPGVVDAAARLRAAGFLMIAVTNQPDVARGTASRKTVEAINHAVRSGLRLDEVMTCFHDDADGCDCRKPKPGQFLRAQDIYGIDLAASFMVGDRWRDMLAAQRAGIEAIFIDYRYDEVYQAAPADFVCGSLTEAAEHILSRSGDPEVGKQ